MEHGQGGGEMPVDGGAEEGAQGGSPVGNLLRATRLRVGEDLRDVARILRIRYPYLEAIEEGRFTDLPGSAYAVGFVRGYADHLGLDSEEIVRRFKAETANAAKKTELVFPSPVSETVMPGGAIIFIGVLLAAIAYGVWYVGTSEDSPLADIIGPLPDRLSTMLNSPATTAPNREGEPASAAPAEEATKEAERPAESPARDAAAPDAAQVAEAAPAEATAPEAVPGGDGEGDKPAEAGAAAPSETPADEARAVASSAPEASDAGEAATAAAPADTPAVPASEREEAPSATETAPTDTPAADTPAPSEQADEQAAVPPDGPSETATDTESAADADAPVEPRAPGPKIEVRAKSPSWIQVRDDVAKTLIVTRLLREGDTYVVPDRDGLSLVTGNAGALEILVDGEAVPAIGGAGAVRRSVALDAVKLKAGTAVSE